MIDLLYFIVGLLQASFQQRCERSGKPRAVLTTGRWFAITPTGPSTERWDFNDAVMVCNCASYQEGNQNNSEQGKRFTKAQRSCLAKV